MTSFEKELDDGCDVNNTFLITCCQGNSTEFGVSIQHDVVRSSCWAGEVADLVVSNLVGAAVV